MIYLYKIMMDVDDQTQKYIGLVNYFPMPNGMFEITQVLAHLPQCKMFVDML